MAKRALIVEDDSNIAELLRLYLGKDGFEVMIAPDGGKAESMFDLFTPDVVLLDIMLPVKDGWQVCRDIRAKSAVPIIMLTAKGETTDKITGLDMGADDYVTKPFDVKELIARVHAVMRRSDNDGPAEKKLTFEADNKSRFLRAGGERRQGRYAAERDGAAVPPRGVPQPRFHPQPAP